MRQKIDCVMRIDGIWGTKWRMKHDSGVKNEQINVLELPLEFVERIMHLIRYQQITLEQMQSIPILEVA